MPGREDFAIIRSRLLADERAHRAAEAYTAAGLVSEPLALAAVVGHVAMLGVWASRETDDGVLPGDGIATFQAATMTPRSSSVRCVGILLECGLLVEVAGGGRYLAGFRDCYEKLIGKRERDRLAAAAARAALAERRSGRPEGVPGRSDGRPQDVGATSERRRSDVGATNPEVGATNANVGATRERRSDVGATSERRIDSSHCTGPDRTGPNPPQRARAPAPAHAPSRTREGTEPQGGGSASPTTNEPAELSAEDRAVVKVIVDAMKKSGLEREREVARRVTAGLRDRSLPPDVARAFVDEWTPGYLERVQAVRRTFAMARNGRNGHGRAGGAA